MAKYLKVPLDCPHPDGFIIRGTNEKGEGVYLCPPTVGSTDNVWLTVRSWALFHTDPEELKRIAEQTLIPAYNIPVDEMQVIPTRNELNIEYEHRLAHFIKYSEVIEE